MRVETAQCSPSRLENIQNPLFGDVGHETCNRFAHGRNIARLCRYLQGKCSGQFHPIVTDIYSKDHKDRIEPYSRPLYSISYSQRFT